MWFPYSSSIHSIHSFESVYLYLAYIYKTQSQNYKEIVLFTGELHQVLLFCVPNLVGISIDYFAKFENLIYQICKVINKNSNQIGNTK